MARARILLADDHKEIREKVMHQLDPEFEVVGAVEDGNALMLAASKMKPDVCIVDISMPIMGGIEAVTQMKASGSTVKIIFLTVHEDPDFLGRPRHGSFGLRGEVARGHGLIPRNQSRARRPIVCFAMPHAACTDRRWERFCAQTPVIVGTV